MKPVQVNPFPINKFYRFVILALLLTSCNFPTPPNNPQDNADMETQLAALPTPDGSVQPTLADQPSPMATRPLYSPGELVDYTAQAGDTLPTLAIRFNTSVDQIMQANPNIPVSATTMPPGMPMKIPIYYLPFWGSSYRIIPDSLFINGPAQINFNTQDFIQQHPGWLNNYNDFVAGRNMTGAQVIDYVAQHYSISPRLLLALLEFHAGALSQVNVSQDQRDFALGYRDFNHKGPVNQILWAANLLNNGYYEWRVGAISSITYQDGRMERFDPWLNASTVSLHNYFNTLFAYDDYVKAIGPDGFAKTYRDLFGDPWQNEQPHIPGSLTQPELRLPFQPGQLWALTGGPHTGWGSFGAPLAAVDFAPPSVSGGCIKSDLWEVAAAAGTVVRSETGEVIIDLDNDGDERTGWDLLYLHVATVGRVPLGTHLKTGDIIGHPSCEGGEATGTHLHLARKYNGEWMPADWTIPLNLEGWIAHNGSEPYLGTLTRDANTVIACTCSFAKSFIKTDLTTAAKTALPQQ
jgi:LasA protease